MLGGHATARHVVERHRIEHALIIDAIDQDDRDAARQPPREPLAVRAERRDQSAFDLDALEEPEVLPLLLLVIVAVAHEHAHAGAGGVLGSTDEIREEGVRDVDDRHAEQSAAPDAQLLRGLERHVAEFVHSCSHAFDDVVADPLGPIQRIRDRAHRHARHAPPRP